jgi:hypothetical protein
MRTLWACGWRIHSGGAACDFGHAFRHFVCCASHRSSEIQNSTIPLPRDRRASIEAPIFNEVLTPIADNVGVLASYISDYYAGQPAVTLRRLSKGRVVHFGSFFTPQNVTALLDALAMQDPLHAWAIFPPRSRQRCGRTRSNGSAFF